MALAVAIPTTSSLLSAPSTTVIWLSRGEANVLLEELKRRLRVDGVIPAAVITVVATQWHGTDSLEPT